MFLDDIQWADKDSLDCWENFVQDAALSNIMFIVAYRDDEDFEIPFLNDGVERSLTDIKLDNLALASVDEILSDLTGMTGVKDLAKIVLEKHMVILFLYFNIWRCCSEKNYLYFRFIPINGYGTWKQSKARPR